MEKKQVRLVDRWKQDAGVAFYGKGGKRTVVADPAKEKKIRERIKEQEREGVDEIEEV